MTAHRKSAYLELEILDLSFEILCQDISRQVFYLQVLDLESPLCLEFQPVAVFLKFALEKIDM